MNATSLTINLTDFDISSDQCNVIHEIIYKEWKCIFLKKIFFSQGNKIIYAKVMLCYLDFNGYRIMLEYYY